MFFFSTTYDSPAGERRKNHVAAAGERGNLRGDDDPEASQKVRKAIAGEEAHRDIRDEKACNRRHRPAPSLLRPPRHPAEPERTQAVAKDTAEVAAAASTKSKEGNDDNRRKGARRREGEEEERKTPTNESPSGDRPSEDNRGEREAARRWTTTKPTPPTIRWHWEVEAAARLVDVAVVADAAKGFDGDDVDES